MVGIGLILWMRNSRLREMLWAGITSCKCLRWDQTAGLSQPQSVLVATVLARWRRGANWYVEMKRTKRFLLEISSMFYENELWLTSPG